MMITRQEQCIQLGARDGTWHDEPLPEDTQKLLDSMVVAMKSIRDIQMRCSRMVEKLQEAPPEQTTLALYALVCRGGRGDLDISMTIAALVAALAEDSGLPYVTRAEIYTAASETGATILAYLLLEGDQASADADTAKPRAIEPRGRSLPLGYRKSAARTRNRETLSHLIHDPSPAVVTILLSNPDLRESEVLTMASKRPASAVSMRLIAAHPRWSQARRIRMAIALNEACPLALACRLCLDLRDQDLQELRKSVSLSPHLRAHAERLITCRRDREAR